MKKKEVLIVLVPILIILILVIIKSLNKDNYSVGAQQTQQVSLEQNYILSLSQFNNKVETNQKIALIDLRSQSEFEKGSLKSALNVPFGEILKNNEISTLKISDNEIVLYSNSIAESAKAWTILTQMGYRNLFLLDIPSNLISKDFTIKDSLITGDEVLKYEFQPDTLQNGNDIP